MQNKGAIKIFAILLALACIFYLSFTWITRGVETEAKEYAESISSSAGVQANAKKYANGDATKELFYVDSLKFIAVLAILSVVGFAVSLPS